MNEPTEPMVVADPDLILPKGRKFFLDDSMFSEGKDGVIVPNFKVKEAAKVFFGKSDDWLRWKMRPRNRRITNPETGEVEILPGDRPDGAFVLDGKPLEFKRTGPNARYFTLADIERMAHALAQSGDIDGQALIHITRMVVSCARLHGAKV